MSSNEVGSISVDVSRNNEEFISPSSIEEHQFLPHSTQIGLDSIDKKKNVGIGDDKSKKTNIFYCIFFSCSIKLHLC